MRHDPQVDLCDTVSAKEYIPNAVCIGRPECDRISCESLGEVDVPTFERKPATLLHFANLIARRVFDGWQFSRHGP